MVQAYKFITKISETGIISLPNEPELFNTEVEVIILPKPKKKDREEKYTAKDFLKDWTGILKNFSEKELQNAKYEYLMEKHK